MLRKLNIEGKVLMYWHKSANSGLWEYPNWRRATEDAEMFAKQEEFYTIILIDVESKEKFLIKGRW